MTRPRVCEIRGLNESSTLGLASQTGDLTGDKFVYEDIGNPRQFNDNLQAYVDRLGGRITGRGKAMCLCPAHGDKNPSLGVTSTDGRLLFHCYAGCPQGDVLEALQARGLWICPPRAETRPVAPPRPKERPSNAGLALKIWQAAIPAAGTLAERYLDGRGLVLPE